MKMLRYIVISFLLLSQVACKKTSDNEQTGKLKSFEFQALKAIPTKDFGFIAICKNQITRINEQGQLVWSRSYSELGLNPNTDSLSGICELLDGRFVISGTRRQVIPSIQSEGAVLLLIFNGEATSKSVYLFDIPELQYNMAATVVQESSTKELFVIGNYKNKANAPNLFCLKTNTDGSRLSLTTSLIGHQGTPYFFIPTALAVNSSGDLMVAGAYEQNSTLHGMHVRINNQGQLLSVRPETSETASDFTTIVPDDNSFVLIGKRNEGNSTELNLNYAFSRIAPTGEALVYQYLGNAKQNHCIAGMKIEGGFALLCFTNGNEAIITDNKCYLSILKLDPNGQMVSEQAYGENYQTMPVAFQMHLDGSFSILALKNAYTNSELLHTVYLHPKPNGKM